MIDGLNGYSDSRGLKDVRAVVAGSSAHLTVFIQFLKTKAPLHDCVNLQNDSLPV